MDLIARVQGILFKPKDEWQHIKGESVPIPHLFTAYAVILAAIPAAARFLNMVLWGRTRIPFSDESIIGRAFIYCVFYYAALLALTFLLGIIINALAQTFSSRQNPVNAMKLSVFSMTPFWIAGILFLIPVGGILVFFAMIYGFYILYLGFDASLMETPKDKIMGYYVITVIATVILFIILMTFVWGIFWGGTLFRVF